MYKYATEPLTIGDKRHFNSKFYVLFVLEGMAECLYCTVLYLVKHCTITSKAHRKVPTIDGMMPDLAKVINNYLKNFKQET